MENVYVMLDIGERNKSRWVRKECIDFLQRQPMPVVLGHPKILALATENPKLWQEILRAVGKDNSVQLSSPALSEFGGASETQSKDSK